MLESAGRRKREVGLEFGEEMLDNPLEGLTLRMLWLVSFFAANVAQQLSFSSIALANLSSTLGFEAFVAFNG